MKKFNIIVATGLVLVLTAFIYRTHTGGIEVSGMDKKTKPQTDFFQFVNGNWLKNNPIPSTESRWGNFNVLNENNTETLRKILEDAASDVNAQPGTVRQKVRDFYRTAMDTVKLEREGTTPALSVLKRVDELNDKADLAKLLGSLHRQGIGAFFGMYVSLDVKDNTKYMVWFSQGGLTLPDRDYYVKQDAKSKKVREEYIKHIRAMYTLFGFSEKEAELAADYILKLETGLAEASMTRVENRNMEKKYNKRALGELRTQWSAFNLDQYMAVTGLAQKMPDTVIVAQPAFFNYLNTAISEQPIAALRYYLRWKIMSDAAGALNDAVGKESFRFFGTVIQGTKEQKPRWKRMVSAANSMIGELVGQEYVKVAFSEEAKKKVNEMVDNLREAYRLCIESLDWMSPETKQKALDKLASFNRKLGYPDKWKDYSALSISTDSYLANQYRCATFNYDKMIDKLGKPVDKTEWNMLPQTVNAYYSPVMNEIVFPAAIMQPPFFDSKADDAVNYGAIGAVIGHEFSHGFDDQGSKYDAKGNFNSWWTSDDRKKFEERTKVLVNQFNSYQVLDSVFINGELTLGENIADLAGLTVAYDAYMISLKGKKKDKIAGFTPEQRFFIGFAQVWRGHARPEYIRNQVLTDPHSPQQYRVYGTLVNMPQFYQAFSVKKGDKMWLDDDKRAKIW
ncbi:MAG: M13 family metallopeptidase [Bacteroidota bacterium]